MDQTTTDEAAEVAIIEQRGGARRRFAVRYLWVKRRVRRVYLILKGLVGLGMGLAGFVAFAVVVLLGVELFRHQIEIKPISVPKALADAGYSPAVAAQRLKDAWARFAESAETLGGLGGLGGRTLDISMHGEVPEIMVPTVGVSISALATHLQSFLGYTPRTTITGELTLLSDQRLSLTLRLDGRVIFHSSEAVSADQVDSIWSKAAEAVMLEISPYRAAFALYDTDPERAIRLAENIIRRKPADENVGWARLLRGAHLMDSLQLSAAEKEFREIIQQAAGAVSILSWTPFAARAAYVEPAQHLLGLTLLLRGQSEAAAAELGKAIWLNPKNPDAHFSLGVALMALNQTREANAELTETRKIYDSVLAGLGDHGRGRAQKHTSLGTFLRLWQEHEDALAQLSWAVTLDPESDEAHRNFCDGLLAAKHLYEAFDECSQAVRLAPNRVENQISLALVLIERHDPERHDLDGARQAGEAALRLAPKSPRVHEMLGKMYQAGGDRDKAAAEYREAARLAPEWAVFYSALGDLLYDQEQFAEAADAYQAVVRLDPQAAVSAELHLKLARTLAKHKDAAGAIEEYKVAIGLLEGSAELRNELALLYNELANFYLDQEKFAEAAAASQAAIALKPREAILRVYLCGALAKQNDIEGAMRECQAAIELEPDNAKLRNGVGNVFYELGKFSDAETAYRAGIGIDSKMPALYYNLANALNQQAQSAGSEASRVELLAKVCQSLTEGLRQVPDEPDLLQGLAAISPKSPESAGCAPSRTPSSQASEVMPP